MVSGTSISANLVPLDLRNLRSPATYFPAFRSSTGRFDAGASKPAEDALLKGANIRIISWAYNFGSRSVLAKKPVKSPEDLAGLKIRTLPNPVITECLRLMGAAATPLAFGEIYTGLAGRRCLMASSTISPTIVASTGFFETAKYYALTQHNFSPLATYFSGTPPSPAWTRSCAKVSSMPRRRRRSIPPDPMRFAVEKEALELLKSKGVTVSECDIEAFLQAQMLPQTG